MEIKIKKLHPFAVIPQYATTGASGFDLVAVEDVSLMPGETKLIPIGLAFEIPEGVGTGTKILSKRLCAWGLRLVARERPSVQCTV
jgi:dUTPase